MRLGVTDANPQEKWIVRAGYFYTNSAGQDCSVVIWSKEIQKEAFKNGTIFEVIPDEKEKERNKFNKLLD